MVVGGQFVMVRPLTPDQPYKVRNNLINETGKTNPQTFVSTQQEYIIIKPANKGSDTVVMDMDR